MSVCLSVCLYVSVYEYPEQTPGGELQKSDDDDNEDNDDDIGHGQ